MLLWKLIKSARIIAHLPIISAVLPMHSDVDVSWYAVSA